MDIHNLILTGLVSSFVFVLSAFTLFYHYPRYMLRMLPKDFARISKLQQKVSGISI